MAAPACTRLRAIGLPVDTDEKTVLRAMNEALARQDARERAADGEKFRAADERTVAAAINAGKIGPGRKHHWLNALRADRPGTTRLLASLAPALPPAEAVAADADMERVHDRVMASLGIKGAAPSPRARTQRPVAAASGFGRQPGEVRPAELPPPAIPPPVRIVRGKPPEQWTSRERDDALLWRLGGPFRRGLRPPPGGDGWYHPSPNDHSEYDPTTGQWRAKTHQQPYREI